MKKFIVEFGMGTDFHGQDVTKAAKKAVKDAVSRSCLCGLDEVLGLTDFTRQVRILATVAVSRPEEVDCAEVASALPVGTVEVRPVSRSMGCASRPSATGTAASRRRWPPLKYSSLNKGGQKWRSAKSK